MDKKKMLIAVIALAVLLVGALVWMVLSGKKPATEETQVTATIPDGEAQKMSDSKSEAFRGSVSTDAYFEMLAGREADEDISLVSSSDTPTPSAGGAAPAASSRESSVDRVFGAPPTTSSAPAASSHRSSGGGSASRPMTSDERLDYERRRAEMVREVLTGGASEETPGQAGNEAAPEPQSIDLSAVDSSDGIISTLDDESSDGVSYGDGVLRPFKCMFVRDQKLVSGQRVTIRLLEDYVEGGVRIPANTHLAAICKIGDRLELQVRSLEMNSRIIPLALDAYDTDGLQGIYCPETTSNKNAREASRDAISAGTTTFGGLVGDLANTVIRTGASIVKNANGELAVNVVSGYEFYLVKSERR